MKIRLLIALISITCAGSISAQVIQYEIDPSFNSYLLLNRGSVDDVLVHENGNVLITGMLQNWNSTAGTTSLFNSNGNLIQSNGDAGSLFKLGHYLNLYIHYGFTGINRFGLPNQNDPEFRFEFSKPAYAGGLPSRVLDALIMPNDHILVAGRFFTDSTLMGTSMASQGLRQLCIIDSTGAPVEDFPMLRCEWPTDSEINSIRKLSTGEYIISGSFNEVDGHPYPKLAKLNADFSVNTDFEPVFEPNASFHGAYAQFIDSQDRIWISRSIDELVLAAAPSYPSNLIRILPSGEIDWSYAAPAFTWYLSGTYEEPGTLRHITANVIEDEDNTFILYGAFVGVNGQPLRRLIKVNDAGEVIDGAFNGLTADSALWSNYNTIGGAVMGTNITVIKKLPDGKLLIGGQFSSFGGEPYSCLVRLQPNGFVGTNDKEGRGKLKLWPNPTLGTFSVQFPNENRLLAKLEIADLQGRVVRQFAAPSDRQFFNVEGLAPGVYVVRAFADGMVYSQKLIVQ